LKVSIYTVEFEQLFWFSTVFPTCFFFSHRRTLCKVAGGISVLTKGHTNTTAKTSTINLQSQQQQETGHALV
jgi:hypothetical protein